jgi:hypothetical protein
VGGLLGSTYQSSFGRGKLGERAHSWVHCEEMAIGEVEAHLHVNSSCGFVATQGPS